MTPRRRDFEQSWRALDGTRLLRERGHFARYLGFLPDEYHPPPDCGRE